MLTCSHRSLVLVEWPGFHWSHWLSEHACHRPDGVKLSRDCQESKLPFLDGFWLLVQYFSHFFWKRCCQRHQKTWIFVVLGSPFSSATLTKVVYVHHLNMYCSLYLLCFYQRYVNKIWILISADTQLWSCTCTLSTILNCSHNLPVGSSISADFWVVTWVRSSDCCFNNTKVLTRDPVQLHFQCFKIDANIYMGFNIWVSSVHCDWRLST